MYIVIPCKPLLAGKSRLASCLNARGRHELCEQLLVQTLELAATLVAPERISVVSADPEVLYIATRNGSAGVHESDDGLNAALDTARTKLLAEDARADALLILPIDLPFATTGAVKDAQACAGDVVIGPDDIRTGTNLLLLRFAALRHLPFCFGPESYPAHLAAARARGLNVATFQDRRIAFDIDGPAQYAAWHAWHACKSPDAASVDLAH